MPNFGENRSEGLGRSVDKGLYASPSVERAESRFTQSIVEGAKLVGNIALAGAAVGVGTAFMAVFDSPEKLKKAAHKVKGRLLDTIPHDIDAGKYLD